MTAVTFSFELPQALILNVNQRLHWAPKAQITRDLRAIGALKGRSSGVVLKRPCILRIVFGWPDNHARDDDNYLPTIKALVDGLVTDAGLLPDDSRHWITERRYRSDITRRGCVEIGLTFEEES